MNTYTDNDGRTRSEVFATIAEATRASSEQLASGNVRAVETTRLDNMPDDHPCPCRSGMKYGRCCRNNPANSTT